MSHSVTTMIDAYQQFFERDELIPEVSSEEDFLPNIQVIVPEPIQSIPMMDDDCFIPIVNGIEFLARLNAFMSRSMRA